MVNASSIGGSGSLTKSNTTPTKLNTALIESDEDPIKLDEDPINFCQRRVVTHLKEFKTLPTKCIEDAESARKHKGRTRFFYFALGIGVAVLGAVTTSFTAIKSLPVIEGNTTNRTNMEIVGIFLGTLSTLAGVGVAILSKDFDYMKFRQRAIDLKELKGELHNKCDELQLSLLKLNQEKASVEEYEELLNLLHTHKQTLEKKASNLGVGI